MQTKTLPKIRVLIVESHAIVREGIRQFLEYADDIEIAGEVDNISSAKELIEQTRPDVVVLDIHMAEGSGSELTRWIRTITPDVGVLVLPAYDDDCYAMAMMEAGANCCVSKTAPPVKLISAVHEVHKTKHCTQINN